MTDGPTPAPPAALQLPYIDAIRAVAILMVVTIHAAAPDVVGSPVGTPLWWFANVLDSVSRPAVPLFLMVSGATLLAKAEPARTFYTKRASRILLPFLVWSGVFFVVHYGWASTPLGFANSIVGDRIHYHLWFFYILIPLYVLTPLLRRGIAAVPTTYLVWFAVLAALLADLNALAPRFSSHLGLDSSAFSVPLGFFVLGYVIAHRGWSFAWPLPLLGAAGLIIVGTYVLSITGGTLDTFLYGPSGLANMVLTASLFVALSRRTRPTSRAVTSLASASFGIYLMHPLILDPLSRSLGDQYGQTPLAGAVIVTVLVITLGASWIITALIGRIPGLRQLV